MAHAAWCATRGFARCTLQALDVARDCVSCLVDAGCGLRVGAGQSLLQRLRNVAVGQNIKFRLAGELEIGSKLHTIAAKRCALSMPLSISSS